MRSVHVYFEEFKIVIPYMYTNGQNYWNTLGNKIIRMIFENHININYLIFVLLSRYI